MYNLYTEQWRKYEIPNKKRVPPSVAKACAATIGEDVYMFGGMYLDISMKTNALWKLSKTPQDSFNLSEIEFQDNAKLPTPRYEHSGWEYADMLWVFGGSGKRPSKLRTEYINDHGDFTQGVNNQLLCYDPSSQTWTNPRCLGAVPSPRADINTTIIEHQVWLFGGYSKMVTFEDFFELNMLTRTWTEIHSIHFKPDGRCSPSLNAISDTQLVLHGGMISSYARTDIETWILDLPSKTWTLHSSNKMCYWVGHTGSVSLNKCVIIIGDDTFT